MPSHHLQALWGPSVLHTAQPTVWHAVSLPSCSSSRYLSHRTTSLQASLRTSSARLSFPRNSPGRILLLAVPFFAHLHLRRCLIPTRGAFFLFWWLLGCRNPFRAHQEVPLAPPAPRPAVLPQGCRCLRPQLPPGFVKRGFLRGQPAPLWHFPCIWLPPSCGA